MSEKYVVVATFTVPMEAHVACGRLSAEGIPAHVTGDGTSSAFAGFGFIGGRVELYVPESACERALDILAECMPGEQWRVMFNKDEHGASAPAADWPSDERVKAGSEELQAQGDTRLWVCTLCGDAVGIKETVCPSCGTVREAVQPSETGPRRGKRRTRRGSTSDIQQEEPAAVNSSLATDFNARAIDKYREGDALANRALKVAMVSFFLLPLSLYSFRVMWRLVQHDGEISPEAVWKFYVAFAVNVVLAAELAVFAAVTGCWRW